MRSKNYFLTLIFSIVLSVPAFAATITGTAKFDGEVPKFKEIKMDADLICLSHHKEAVYPQKLVLGEGNTMGNVFVRVASGLAKKDYPVPTQAAVLSQVGCMYDPHVIAIMQGQTLKILNPDGTLHNVHSLSKINPEFNLAMPKFKTETTKVYDKAEFMFAMKCDVHPWMEAWVTVTENPFFNVTKADGKFTIDNLPAGTYDIEAWHEKLGTQKQTVTVAEGETKDLAFTFSKPGSKK